MPTDALPAVDEITYVVGNAKALSSEYCDPPFADDIVECCAALSRQLLASEAAKAFPDLVTFAFYCRPANIARLKAEVSQPSARLGWGRALHIAPANIPINVAYSFLFGLLSGNGNVVRLPSAAFPQIAIFCQCVQDVLSEARFTRIREATAFVRFARSSQFLQETLAEFDALMVWGGDETINTIRQFPRAPRSIEIAFADRYSMAVIGAKAILESDDSTLQSLCEHCYNDTFLVDQQACSSPQLFCWLGDPNDVAQAKRRFWQAFGVWVDQRYDAVANHAMDRQIGVLKALDTHETEMTVEQFGLSVVVARLEEANRFSHQLRGGVGLFFEVDTLTLPEIVTRIDKKTQTLSYFGVEKASIETVIMEARCKGIDRVVPIGEALDIGTVWDGYDLIHTLSRRITFR